LEPEAAALFCQQEIRSIYDSPLSTVKELPSICYLVVDCGGGTVDMVAHRLTITPVKTDKPDDEEICIDEIHSAHGGPHGGCKVNDEFECMLIELFQLTDKNLKEIKYECSQQWTKLIHEEFDKCKDDVCRNISDESLKSVLNELMQNTQLSERSIKIKQEITIPIPKKLLKKVEKMHKKSIEKLIDEYKEKFKWDEDEEALVLPFLTVCSLFLPVINKIILSIKNILEKPECKIIKMILLVGGFAESNLLYFAIANSFSPAIIVKRPFSPTLSVLKGAAIYSKKQKMIKSRKMRQSLGILVASKFVQGFHDDTKKIIIDGVTFCDKIFFKFVEINETIHTNQCIKHKFTPLSKYTDYCNLHIYGSRNSKAYYTDEKCCYHVGRITVKELPKYESEISRSILVTMDVSGTEIMVSAFCNETTKKLPVVLEFITNLYKSNDDKRVCTSDK